MRAIKSALIFIIPMALNFNNASAAGKFHLQLNLEPNSSYLCTTDMRRTIAQTVDNADQTADQNVLTSWQYDVLSRDNSGMMDIRLTFKRIKMNMTFGGQTMQYDSDNPPDSLDPPMKGMESLIGQSLTLRLAPDGKISDIRGVDAMLDKMITAIDLPESPSREMLIGNLRRQFGQEAIKQSIQQILSFYPSNAVDTEESWKLETKSTTEFPMRVVSNYKLISRTGGVDTIDVASEILSNPDSKSSSGGPMSALYDIKGNQSGTIIVDEASGLPLNADLDMNFNGTVTVSGGPNREKKTLPISSEGTVRMTFEKLQF